MKFAVLAATSLLFAVPAFADAPPPPTAEDQRQLEAQLNAAAPHSLPDPFVSSLKEGEAMPPLKCGNLEAFKAAVKAHDGSPVVTMGDAQAMFWRGMFAVLPFTPPGYPVGEHVVWAARAASDKDGKAIVQGVVGFTLGDSMVCNVLPISDQTIRLLNMAGGANSASF
jgi:hypothetical protein